MWEIIRKYPLTLSLSSLFFLGSATFWVILSPQTAREKTFSLLSYFMGAFAALIVSIFVNNLKISGNNRENSPKITQK